MKVQLDPCAHIPTRAHQFDAGLDLRSTGDYMIPKLESMSIDTGVHVEIPEGYVGFIKSRSSMMKFGVVTDGTIDCGYTGSIKVCLFNHSLSDYYIDDGDKIAQLVVVPCVTDDIEVVDRLQSTERGSNGFGSTGK